MKKTESIDIKGEIVEIKESFDCGHFINLIIKDEYDDEWTLRLRTRNEKGVFLNQIVEKYLSSTTKFLFSGSVKTIYRRCLFFPSCWKPRPVARRYTGKIQHENLVWEINYAEIICLPGGEIIRTKHELTQVK